MALSKNKASELGKKSTRKGVPNKSTTEIRQAFQLLISNELPNLSKWLEQVANENPEKALDIIIKFSDFVIPKFQRTEIQAEININGLLKMTTEQRRQRILELEKEFKTK
jgi:hypothetical protein